jgi:hypothetical protein
MSGGVEQMKPSPTRYVSDTHEPIENALADEHPILAQNASAAG